MDTAVLDMDGTLLVKAVAGERVEADHGDGLRSAWTEEFTVRTGGFPEAELRAAGAAQVFDDLVDVRRAPDDADLAKAS